MKEEHSRDLTNLDLMGRGCGEMGLGRVARRFGLLGWYNISI